MHDLEQLHYANEIYQAPKKEKKEDDEEDIAFKKRKQEEAAALKAAKVYDEKGHYFLKLQRGSSFLGCNDLPSYVMYRSHFTPLLDKLGGIWKTKKAVLLVGNAGRFPHRPCLDLKLVSC